MLDHTSQTNYHHPTMAQPTHRPHHLQLSESDIDTSSLSQNLAPPPAAPHGPRSPIPISLHSRTPSPPTPKLEPYLNGLSSYDHDGRGSMNGYENEDDQPSKPSAKALGKRKVIEADAVSDRKRSSY